MKFGGRFRGKGRSSDQEGGRTSELLGAGEGLLRSGGRASSDQEGGISKVRGTGHCFWLVAELLMPAQRGGDSQLSSRRSSVQGTPRGTPGTAAARSSGGGVGANRAALAKLHTAWRELRDFSIRSLYAESDAAHYEFGAEEYQCQHLVGFGSYREVSLPAGGGAMFLYKKWL